MLGKECLLKGGEEDLRGVYHYTVHCEVDNQSTQWFTLWFCYVYPTPTSIFGDCEITSISSHNVSGSLGTDVTIEGNKNLSKYALNLCREDTNETLLLPFSSSGVEDPLSYFSSSQLLFSRDDNGKTISLRIEVVYAEE